MTKKLENRELYDLCRRYKYAFKKHDEIKHLNKCYWSKYIAKAYMEAAKDLEEAKYEMVKYILKEFIDFNNLDMEANIDWHKFYGINGEMMRRKNMETFKVTCHNEKFYKICAKIWRDEYE